MPDHHAGLRRQWLEDQRAAADRKAQRLKSRTGAVAAIVAQQRARREAWKAARQQQLQAQREEGLAAQVRPAPY